LTIPQLIAFMMVSIRYIGQQATNQFSVGRQLLRHLLLANALYIAHHFLVTFAFAFWLTRFCVALVLLLCCSSRPLPGDESASLDVHSLSRAIRRVHSRASGTILVRKERQRHPCKRMAVIRPHHLQRRHAHLPPRTPTSAQICVIRAGCCREGGRRRSHWRREIFTDAAPLPNPRPCKWHYFDRWCRHTQAWATLTSEAPCHYPTGLTPAAGDRPIQSRPIQRAQ
jgi:hypothetical protein